MAMSRQAALRAAQEKHSPDPPRDRTREAVTRRAPCIGSHTESVEADWSDRCEYITMAT